MLVDSHCHLTDERLEKKLEDVFKGMEVEGVKRVMVASGSVKDSKAVVGLVKRFNEVDGVVGIHPEMVGKSSFDVEVEIKKLEELIEKEQEFIKGIGEIGLDFYYDKEKKSKEVQIRLFEEQLGLAKRKNLPVVIHMRDAEEEMRMVLKNFDGLRGMFHCWSGDKNMLKFVLDRGFYVSVAGNVTFKNADKLRDLVKLIPKESLLLETDSPYLSPEPARGGLNEPKNVKILAKFVAGLRKVKTPDLIEQTGKNYLCLFG